jgi:hypothetical protein
VSRRKDCDVRAARHDIHFGDQVDVREGAASEPDEARRIQPGFKVFQAIGNRIPLVLGRRQVEQLAFGDDRRDL